MKLYVAIFCVVLVAANGVNGEVKPLTDSEFDATVKEGNFMMVQFWAVWCGPCRMLNPVVEAIADEYSGDLAVYSMDTDANMETPAKYGIRSIPTILFFKDGDFVNTVVGAVPRSKLEEVIDALL